MLERKAWKLYRKVRDQYPFDSAERATITTGIRLYATPDQRAAAVLTLARYHTDLDYDDVTGLVREISPRTFTDAQLDQSWSSVTTTYDAIQDLEADPAHASMYVDPDETHAPWTAVADALTREFVTDRDDAVLLLTGGRP